MQPESKTTWQTIETAPSDGDYILVSGTSVLCSDDKYVCEAYGGINGFYGSQGKLPNQPTHWMPLPEPPNV